MTYGLLVRPLEVTDGKGLSELSSLLHDETCSVDHIVHDQAARTLLLPVRRQFHGGKETAVKAKSGWITYEKAWMRSRVLIRHVQTWDLMDDEGIGAYSFNEWRWEGNTIEIVFCGWLRLTVAVDTLNVTMTDLGFKGRARIKRYLGGLIESSSSKVY